MRSEKIRRHILKTIEGKHHFIQSEAREFCVDELCLILEVSRSGYYAWRKRGISRQKQRNQKLERELVRLHEAYPALGLDGLYHMIKSAIPCSRGRIHRLMKRQNIHSARKKVCKATTNSNHS